MYSLIAPAVFLSTVVGLTYSPPSAVSTAEQPYRVVTSVVIVPEVDTGVTDFYIECHDGSGAEELWQIAASGGRTDSPASFSLSIDGAFQFSVSTVMAPLEITVSTTPGNAMTFDQSTYSVKADYLAFLQATDLQRGFVLDLVQEYRAVGTMLGVTPIVILPDSDDPPIETDNVFDPDRDSLAVMPASASVPLPAAQAGNRAKCIADVTLVFGPKPADCEGAWDEYKCCIWEMHVDACTRQRDCDGGPWWGYVPCMAAAVVLNGLDTTACIVSLPVPGG